MAIIVVSRGCFSHGKEIAEMVAARLGYECLSKEILLEASSAFHVPQKLLERSILTTPGLLERFTHAREHFLDCVQSALLEHARRDHIVYHGHAGHMFLPGIAHVVKVRIMAEMQERIRLVQQKEQLSLDKARQLIENEDQQRKAWYQQIYKMDMSDPILYDMVLHIGRLSIADAAALICQTASQKSFARTETSQQALADLAVTYHVRTLLADICDAEVQSRRGIVTVRVRGQRLTSSGFTRPGLQKRMKAHMQEELQREITAALSGVTGIKELVCHIDSPYYA